MHKTGREAIKDEKVPSEDPYNLESIVKSMEKCGYY